ncbi:MAG: glucose-6-phosphate isomerase [Synechococcus sp. SB0666_bin_14]|nr:glucose-6-phosphate isomerase [Synechococcus sp. SB0666_bin_14]MYG46282.1 glucose-6-phosphate isomerase [Synechococcus sp. SB0675_bin_6]MYJ59036.1 glucose-6-phosphate isomerase [Synechococcus sp. SB0672_bin_6]MYK91391.1 glucose-6-phosphate isomerase [Synechococcus sp. SB0669_bin_8]
MSLAPQIPSFPPLETTNQQQRWERFCALLWHDEGLGFWLDASRMALSPQVLTSLQPRFDSAFAAMAALEKGSIANPDEQRQVGHYWLRTPQLAPDPAITEALLQQQQAMTAFAQDVLEGSVTTPSGAAFTDVVWIGIGGSGLGPLLVVHALQQTGVGLGFHFIDNVDPEGMGRIYGELGERLKTSLVIVVSKSGSTPEPHVGMVQTRRRLEQLGGAWPAQAVVITVPGSKLDRQAASEGWLQRFALHDWVGGRTSITSAVGLLPGLLAGVPMADFLAGAATMDSATRQPALCGNPAALMAASWFVAGSGRGTRDMVVLPYRDRLQVFSRYLQQLVMESLGKRCDRDGMVVHQGIAVYGNKGSTDQHAYVQQLRDGIDNFFVTFIEVLQDPPVASLTEEDDSPGDLLDGFLQGTRSALTEGGRQSLTITMEQLGPRELGALVALFERAVGLYGELVNVNAYHQPGVEAGKKAAAAVLSLQKQVAALLDATPRTAVEIAQAVGAPEQVERVFWILRHMALNQPHLRVDGSWGHPRTLRFFKG